MSDVQQMFDALKEVMRNTRRGYHLSLGSAITALEGAEAAGLADAPVVFSHDTRQHAGGLLSYRGFYDDLAFSPVVEIRTVRDVLDDCKRAVGSVFEGYKGGDFTMRENTPLWCSEWGEASGVAVGGVVVDGGRVVLVTRMVDP